MLPSSLLDSDRMVIKVYKKKFLIIACVLFLYFEIEQLCMTIIGTVYCFKENHFKLQQFDQNIFSTKSSYVDN